MRDRSLDEFATDEASEPDVNRDADDVADDANDVADDADDVDRDTSEDDVTAADEAEAPVVPARSTYEWSPDGTDCVDCGARVERRWRDDDALVCSACKTW